MQCMFDLMGNSRGLLRPRWIRDAAVSPTHRTRAASFHAPLTPYAAPAILSLLGVTYSLAERSLRERVIKRA